MTVLGHTHSCMFITHSPTPPLVHRLCTHWYILLEADSAHWSDCGLGHSSGCGRGGYYSANLTSKRSFCWGLSLRLSLGKCNTSRGGDWTLHLHRRISWLLSIFNVLRDTKSIMFWKLTCDWRNLNRSTTFTVIRTTNKDPFLKLSN